MTEQETQQVEKPKEKSVVETKKEVSPVEKVNKQTFKSQTFLKSPAGSFFKKTGVGFSKVPTRKKYLSDKLRVLKFQNKLEKLRLHNQIERIKMQKKVMGLQQKGKLPLTQYQLELLKPKQIGFSQIGIMSYPDVNGESSMQINSDINSAFKADIGHGDSLFGNEEYFGGEQYYGENWYGDEDMFGEFKFVRARLLNGEHPFML
jgi:hypothetical protein